MERKKPNILMPTPETLKKVHDALCRREVVGVPTETVYGLAARADHEEAISRIFELKNRPSFNPLILHYPHASAAQQDVEMGVEALRLAEAFWPGPLTLVLPRKPLSSVVPHVSAGLSTVAVRVPSHPFLQALLQTLPFPLAAPSANFSGRLSTTTAEHVAEAFGESIRMIVDGGPCVLGIESTVVDLSSEHPRLLRQGATPQNALEDVLKKILGVATLQDKQKLLSPGLLESHYAPRQPLRLYATTACSHESLLAFGPPCAGDPIAVENLSLAGNLEEAASRLFACLHRLEKTPCIQIAVMPIPEEGIGCAINDRLKRAAAPRAGS